MNQSLIPSSCPPESDQPAFVQNTARILVLMQIKIQGGEGGDRVSSVAAVREAQARQRAASRNDRRRCLNCSTGGAPRSASAIARSLKNRAPLQLGNPAIFKRSHYPFLCVFVVFAGKMSNA